MVHLPVGSDRNQLPAVGAVGESADELVLLFQESSLKTGYGVPETDGAVPARRGDLLAVRSEGNVINETRVLAQDAGPLGQPNIPDAAGPVQGG